jgi:hypothetical protein
MKLRCLVTALMAVWFMCAPWVIGFSGHMAPVVVCVMFGAIQLVSSLWAYTKPAGDSLQNLIILITGLLFAVFPFTFLPVRSGIFITLFGMLTLALSFRNLSSN